jgi:hypothetical protein
MNINKEINPAKGVGTESIDQVSVMTPVDIPTAGNFVMKTKVCPRCSQELPIFEFPKQSKNIRSYCTKCKKEKKRDHGRSINGLTYSMFSSQKQRTKLHGYDDVAYTLKEFRQWCFAQHRFWSLYGGWVRSGYDHSLIPSCDRLNDYKGYSFDNIRIVSWSVNKQKGFDDTKSGVNTKKQRAVVQYDRYGRYIREFYSIAEASRSTGTNSECIGGACRGKYEFGNGYKWKYKTDNNGNKQN